MSINLFLIFFLFGLFLGDNLPFQKQPLFCLLFISLLLLGLSFLVSQRSKLILAGLSGFCFGLFWIGLFLPQNQPNHISHYNGQVVTIYGWIDEEPTLSEGKTKFTLKIEGIQGRVLVQLPFYDQYQYGDSLKMKGKLKEPPVFDDFNYRNYLKGANIYSLLINPKIEKLNQFKGSPLKKSLFALKNRFQEKLNQFLPEPEASLANGLLFGERTTFPPWLKESFVNSGIIHITALSGYNVSIISKSLSLFFDQLFPSLSFWCALPLIWLFVLMVGAQTTIVRAAIFASLLLIAPKVGRRRDVLRGLLLVATLMTLPNPFILKYDSSFQLSFLATASLFYLTPSLEKWLGSWQDLDWVKDAIVTTCSAQLFVLPILLFGFKQLSLIALLTNALVLPIVPLTMLFVFLTACLAFLSSSFASLFSFFAFILLKYIILVSLHLSKLPFAVVKVTPTTFWWTFPYWLAIYLLVRYFHSLKDRPKGVIIKLPKKRS